MRWEEGVPVALDGKRSDLVELFDKANKTAGKHASVSLLSISKRSDRWKRRSFGRNHG